MVESITTFDQIRGLRAVWARMTGHDSPVDARPLPIRPLLDTLGLGLEQAMSMLGRERPDWPTSFPVRLCRDSRSPKPCAGWPER